VSETFIIYKAQKIASIMGIMGGFFFFFFKEIVFWVPVSVNGGDWLRFFFHVKNSPIYQLFLDCSYQ